MLRTIARRILPSFIGSVKGFLFKFSVIYKSRKIIYAIILAKDLKSCKTGDTMISDAGNASNTIEL